MVELLVAMVILVIAFGLVTYLYTKAARIRKIVVINSEVQQALSQMMDTLTYGETNSWGLKDALRLTDLTIEETRITVANAASEQMTAEIITDPEEEDGIITLVITRTPPGTPLVVDINRKIQLYAGSKFQCFDCKGTLLTPADFANTTLVKITFWAKSTDPAFKNAPPIPFITAVRLCNKPSF